MKEKRTHLRANGILLGLTALFLCGLFLLDHYDGERAADFVETEKATAEVTVQTGATDEAAENDGPMELPEETPQVKGLICLNTATAEELETLPGIGPELARQILEYREVTGPFLSVEELIYISGLGAETLAGLKDYITIDGGGER